MTPPRAASRPPTPPTADRPRPLVVLGLLGTTLDAGTGRKRWGRWRPTVGLCQHEDLLVDRLELIHDARFERLAGTVEQDIASVSPETTVRRQVLDFADPWDFEEVYGALRDFAGAYPFDPEREDYLVHITTGTHVAQICQFLLTESRHIPARLLQTGPPRRGGHGEPRGPAPRRPSRESDANANADPHAAEERTPHDVAGEYRIIDLDLSRYDRLAARFEREHQDAVSSLKSGIATRNDAFNRLIERMEHVAGRTEDPVLITGPTGAGKSRLAARIFEVRRARQRLRGAFVEVNCATLRGDTAMSTLFGHRRGAFTGATTDRPGLLRAADGGMLFLDEVGELGLDEQAMLLRALEEKRFLPVGADREVSSDFQLVAGTNRDLLDAVRRGRFREDLLARIDLWTFELPALRERPEDIEPNLDYELESFAARRGHLVRFNREARARFLAFAAGPAGTWPGNFRDLNAALTRMATLAPGGRITPAVVDEEIARLQRSWGRRADPAGGSSSRDDAAVLASVLPAAAVEELDRLDRVQLAEVVRVCRASRTLSEAGRTLFAASRRRRRSTNDSDRVRKLLLRHGLDWATVTGGGASSEAPADT
jgi:transcriptional regulatory protein RtcR